MLFENVVCVVVWKKTAYSQALSPLGSPVVRKPARHDKPLHLSGQAELPDSGEIDDDRYEELPMTRVNS